MVTIKSYGHRVLCPLSRQEVKGKEGEGKEGKGREGKGRESEGRDRNAKDGIGREEKGRERKGKERKGKERKGKERKGREGKGKERKGKEGRKKGRERKGREKKEAWAGQCVRVRVGGCECGWVPFSWSTGVVNSESMHQLTTAWHLWQCGYALFRVACTRCWCWCPTRCWWRQWALGACASRLTELTLGAIPHSAHLCSFLCATQLKTQSPQGTYFCYRSSKLKALKALTFATARLPLCALDTCCQYMHAHAQACNRTQVHGFKWHAAFWDLRKKGPAHGMPHCGTC
eukprot:1157442-Pelagomonas_calceolata.AAC.14